MKEKGIGGEERRELEGGEGEQVSHRQGRVSRLPETD